MGVNIILARSMDLQFRETGGSITREEWMRLVADDDDLRFRADPHVAVNPESRERISIAAGDAETELRVDQAYVPFLRFRKGELVIGYTSELDSPTSPIRQKIAEIAKRFGALITHDAGDEILDW